MPFGKEATASDNRPLPRVCFIHIPKTAGTAIRERMFELYGDLAFQGYTTEDYGVASDEDLARYRFFAGHPYWRDWKRLPAGTKLFTVLRDPVARAISLYKHWRTVDTTDLESRGPAYALMVDALRTARLRPIEEFLQSDNPFIVVNVRCVYARQLVPETMVHLDGTPSIATFDMAVGQLFALDVVLTTERLNQTFPRALKRLGLNHTELPIERKNVSTVRLEYDEARLNEIVRKISAMDFHLYAVARELEARMA